MRHGSLFSGIGGFDLAAEWMGWENVFHCEWEDFPRKVLHHYWPNAISYGDITKTDFTIHRASIDILSGGFPCQPYSQAGKRLGKEDERHLWPHMLRAIREIQPRWVVGENVLGLVNWNDGLVFEEVCADLESEGYEVQPFILPAAGVNAPHQRYRVWFVGYNSTYADNRIGSGNAIQTRRPQLEKLHGLERPTSDTEGKRYEPSTNSWESMESQKGEDVFCGERYAGASAWEDFPTQSPVCSRNDRFPGKLDGITFSKWRAESIKAYGNAVVPQVVLQIFKAIEEYEKIRKL